MKKNLTARPSFGLAWVVGTALVAACLHNSAWAQSAAPTTAWPDNKPIRIVLPFPPGGPSDITIRLAAEKMQAVLKQPFVIDNKPGASGNIGAAEVARAVPDGHTWLFAPDTITTVNPHVFKRMPYKVDELAPVTVAAKFGQILVCNPSLNVKSVGELVALSGRSKLTYASGGAGVPGHLTMEQLLSAANFNMTHIPYKGPALAMQDVLGNQVHCGFLAGPTVLPQVRSGKLVALAVAGSERSALLPDVPTVEQTGVKNAVADFALALWAPKATPPAIVARMRDAMNDALRQPDVQDKLKAADMTVIASTPAQAATTLAQDSQKWGALVRKINLGLD